MKIDVKATENLSHITYQVFAKGALVVSDTVEVPNTKNFKFDITPTAEMLPTAKVVVHYISIYGEIISHQTDIEFGNEFVNYVKLFKSTNEMFAELNHSRLTLSFRRIKRSPVSKSRFPSARSRIPSSLCWVWIKAFCYSSQETTSRSRLCWTRWKFITEWTSGTTTGSRMWIIGSTKISIQLCSLRMQRRKWVRAFIRCEMPKKC